MDNNIILKRRFSFFNSTTWLVIKFWFSLILFFEVARIVFLISNSSLLSSAGISECLRSLLHGLKMDMSMSAYLALPVALLLLFSGLISIKVLKKIIKIYSSIIVIIILLIIVADVFLFKAWGNRIDATPLKYFSNPKEVWASISHLPVFWITFLFVIFSIILIFLIKKWVNKLFNPIDLNNKAIQILMLILLMGVLIIPLRGGLQLAPLNQSSVYFSDNNFANQAAINAPWNLMYSINHNENDTKNPFVVSSDSIVKITLDSLFENSGKTIQFLDSTKPLNIILITWESFTAKAIDAVKEGIEITPGYNRLKREGVYFSNIYASGDRTDKGIVSILSGYPAFATTSIVKTPKKAASLPILGRDFLKHNYSTAFYYGGETEFANMKAYLMQGGFKKFITISDFNKEDQNSKWGAHDGVVSKKIQNELKTISSPFFINWLTLSSHEPYEVPVPSVFKGKDDESLFLNSIHYTDSIIYEFVNYAKKQSWWKNTVIVIIPDHGARLPRTNKIVDNFKISFLFLGGALIKTPQEIKTLGSQNDFAATLLNQLKFQAKEYSWSKNLMDSAVNKWAYFSYNNAFGFVHPNSMYIFDNIGKRIIEKEGEVRSSDILIGREFQQATYGDYLKR